MKVGKYFLSSLGGRFSTTSVVKAERKLLLDNGIQQKKGWIGRNLPFC